MLKKVYRFLAPRFQTLFLEYKVDFKPRHGHGLPPHAHLEFVVNANRDEYVKWLHTFAKYKAQLQSIQKMDAVQDANQPGWNNGFLPGLDIMALYVLLAELKPKRYVEIGSGNSTKVAHKAKKDLGLDMQIVSIDPFPRAEIDHLADQVIRTPFENLDNAFLKDLDENDVLFVDNSHRVFPNSDATVFFMEVLPELKKVWWCTSTISTSRTIIRNSCATVFTRSNTYWQHFCSPIRTTIPQYCPITLFPRTKN